MKLSESRILPSKPKSMGAAGCRPWCKLELNLGRFWWCPQIPSSPADHFLVEIPTAQCYDWCPAPPHESSEYRCVSSLQLRSRNCKPPILVLLKGKAILGICISATQSFSSRSPCTRARACFYCQSFFFTSQVPLSCCCIHSWLCFVGYLEMLFGGCF